MIFFASVPFGPNVNEYVAWIQHGGGYQLYEKGYGEHNIKGFQCGIVVAESSGWFREPIETPGRPQGPEDAFLRPGRQGDGQARRLDPADAPAPTSIRRSSAA